MHPFMTAFQPVFWDFNLNSHYRKSLVALFVYDVTREDTFLSAINYVNNLRAGAEPDCIIYLVGNFIDKFEADP